MFSTYVLESKTFTGFASELKECETQTSIVIVDWETTWDSGLFLVLFDPKIIARLLLKSGNKLHIKYYYIIYRCSQSQWE